MKLGKPRIIYNDDSDSLRYVPQPHTEAKVAMAVDYLKGSQVDCFCWCVAYEIAYGYPSRVIDNIFELRKKMKGEMVGLDLSKDLVMSLRLKGVDYLPILIRQTQKRNIRFFASIRMNDVHHKSEPESVLATEFWKTHQHWRLWEVSDARSYYNAALDYSYSEVRKRKVDVVFEAAENYDIDGIELDFCRSPYYFQPSEAWGKRGVLTDFVSEIREGLGRIGRKRKRTVELIVRVPFGEEFWHGSTVPGSRFNGWRFSGSTRSTVNP